MPFINMGNGEMMEKFNYINAISTFSFLSQIKMFMIFLVLILYLNDLYFKSDFNFSQVLEENFKQKLLF